ncbi:MAG: hypothetical protein ACYDDU_18175 [Dermatophilaceae bacterium]
MLIQRYTGTKVHEQLTTGIPQLTTGIPQLTTGIPQLTLGSLS